MFKKNKESGFSLVELMVVVAIIGILATVAIPRVTKFIAKSRTSEAQGNLTTLYTFEKNFFVEYSGYVGDFVDLGLVPEGKSRYIFGFKAAAGGCPSSFAASGHVCALANPNNITGAAGPYVCSAVSTTCQLINGATNAAPTAALLVATPIPANFSTFTAAAGAILTSTGGNDQWTIDDSKMLAQANDGTN